MAAMAKLLQPSMWHGMHLDNHVKVARYPWTRVRLWGRGRGREEEVGVARVCSVIKKRASTLRIREDNLYLS